MLPRAPSPLLLLSLPIGAFLLATPPAAGEAIRIAGRILASGGPLADLHLYAEPPSSESSRAAYLLDGKAPSSVRQEFPLKEDGGFVFGVPGQPNFVLVAKEGDLRFEREIRGAPAGDIPTLEIPLASRLEGEVLGPKDEPLAGAVVYLEKPDFPQIAPWKLSPLRQVTDEKGRFSLPFFPQSRLAVFAKGFAPRSYSLDSLARAPRRIRLEKAEARHLWVYREPGVAEAGVLVATGEGIPLGLTDVKGATELWVSGDAPLFLTAEAVRSRWKVEKPGWHQGELRLLVAGRVVLGGEVLKADGEPCAGARVEVRLPGQQGRPRAEGATDARGRFQLGPLEGDSFPRLRDAPKPPLQIRISSPGHALRTVEWEIQPGDYLQELPRQQLDVAVEVSGRIVDASGGAIPAAEIYLRPPAAPQHVDSRKPSEKPSSLSNGDGAFTVSEVAAGEEIALEVRAKGFLPLVERGVIGGMAGLEIQLERATAVEVRVLGPQGEPVPRAWVSLYPMPPEAAGPAEGTRPSSPRDFSALTDEKGLASLAEVERGKLHLQVSAEGYLDGQKEIEVSEKPLALEIRLSQGVVVEGTVTDAQGRPAAHASIEINSAALTGSVGATDESGFYRIGGLSPGVATILARTPSGVAQAEVQLIADTRMRLDLQASRELYELRGIVVDAAGNPLAGRRIRLKMITQGPEGGATGMLSYGTTTAGDGSFVFEIAETRRYVIDVLSPGPERIGAEAAASLEVDVQHSETVRLVVPD